MDNHMEKCLNWMLMVSLSPIAILVLILLALVNFLRFLLKTSLLFIIIAINTPFAVMYNVSTLVFEYYGAHFRKSIARFPKLNACFGESKAPHWNWSDPRASVGIELQTIVSDFFKVIAGELLVVISGGIITFYTAPLKVFYISMAISLVALSHKWLNTECLSKIALSCLFDGYGLNPMMFLFSYIGFFNLGGHPVAKCSFVASRAFLFVENVPIPFDEMNRIARPKEMVKVIDNEEVGDHRFNGVVPLSNWQGGHLFIFFKWNAFERGLFQLNPKIEIINRDRAGKYILKSFMVLKLLDNVICEYLVDMLELPEDFSKGNELYNFLTTLSLNDGFVTDKMRGRYEHSLTLLQIVEGVQENAGYSIVDTKLKEEVFIVAGGID